MKISAFILFLLTSLSTYSQSTAFDDALAHFEKANTAANANAVFKILNEEEFADEPLVAGKDTPADSLRMQVWYWAGEWYHDQQDYQKATEYAEKALPLCKAGGNRQIEGDCLNLLSVIHIRLSDYEKAADYAQQCYKIDQQSGDPDKISSSLNTLAAIYLGANQPGEAEKYVLKGIEMAGKANNSQRMATLHGMASDIYHAKGEDEKALGYIEKAYELDKQDGREGKAAMRLAQKASVLLGLHQYADAEEVLNEAIPQFKSNGDMQSLAIASNKMGMALLCQDKKEEAANYYSTAADLCQQLHDTYNEIHARRGLYESLWELRPDEAKIHLNRFNDLKDSLYSNASAESLARYNAEFENDTLALEKHNEHRGKLWAIGIAAILAVGGLLLWHIMRRRQSRQTAINEKLTTDINDLHEKYRQLNKQYDNALQTTPGKEQDSEELTISDREFIERSVNAINSLINDGKLDAKSVAEKMNLSLFQFRQRITAITGETAQSFIQTIRMSRARHLLDNNPELNITEIALMCAYNDAPNFTRAFKNTFGITPTQYLEKKHK